MPHLLTHPPSRSKNSNIWPSAKDISPLRKHWISRGAKWWRSFFSRELKSHLSCGLSVNHSEPCTWHWKPKDPQTRLFSLKASFVLWGNSRFSFVSSLSSLHFIKPGPLCLYQHIQHLCFVLFWDSILVWSGPLLDWLTLSIILHPKSVLRLFLLRPCRQSFVALCVYLADSTTSEGH